MEKNITKEWLKAFTSLNEAQKRWFSATKAIELGYGGISAVSQSTGLSRTTITQGCSELKSKKLLPSFNEKLRKSGAGRKKTSTTDLELTKEIEEILEESSAGDPMSKIKWTCKSTRNISNILLKKGFNVSYVTVMRILQKEGYSLRSNKKMLSGKNHPDRDAQFRYISKLANKFTSKDYPVISVDTKKKELVGNFKNNGRVWGKEDIEVMDHDFRSLGEGMAIPYGAYDISRNEGFVNVGTSSDTAEFAVNSIWQWWRHFGRKHYTHAEEVLICADGGGSNGSRVKAWKFYLQELANKTGLSITVVHYPPGTSKWNKIEHKMFSFISMNWKGRPLENYESIINLISSTKTKSGLKIKAKLDQKKYKKGVKVSKEEFNNISLEFHKKFPKWNYTIHPFN
eukprot:TRINITY_DN3418_c0_g2_i1.p1 TRINITY_DN3418_c0_g2~~TRINITY_DN3418_c0_g2_i1.p1  ORF type:complete len:399 (+),score=28.35 TRINITY_DN3418_c0_g2_i1:53-1249(+)